MIRDSQVTGFYAAKATTGVLAAALAVDAPVFAMRNGPTANNKIVYVTRINLAFDIGTAFTAVQQFGFYLQRFTTANMAAGGAVTPMKIRSADPNSACLGGGPEGGDCRVSATAALTNAGVVFGGETGIPLIGWQDVTAGKAIVGYGFNAGDGNPDAQPIELVAGDGLCLRNLVVWPAAGTGTLTATVFWYERNAK